MPSVSLLLSMNPRVLVPFIQLITVLADPLAPNIVIFLPGECKAVQGKAMKARKMEHTLWRDVNIACTRVKARRHAHRITIGSSSDTSLYANVANRYYQTQQSKQKEKKTNISAVRTWMVPNGLPAVPVPEPPCDTYLETVVERAVRFIATTHHVVAPNTGVEKESRLKTSTKHIQDQALLMIKFLSLLL